MTGFPYELAPDHGGPAVLGLIVLRVDQTVEWDFRRLFAPQTAIVHVSRVPSANDLTPDSISAMADALPVAAGLMPPATRFDAVGYACTSGAAGIGPGRVADLVSGACRTRAVSDPLTAAIAALQAVGARRVGLISPYTSDVAAPLVAALQDTGIAVPEAVSFDEAQESRVVRIDPASLGAAATHLTGQRNVDTVFLSCTNLRTLDILPSLTRDLGVPVLGSNLVLAWHMARLAGIGLSAPWSALLPEHGPKV
ncbi:MAG: maleate cis-trans isomerase family protein [Marinibacterium sp.]